MLRWKVGNSISDHVQGSSGDNNLVVTALSIFEIHSRKEHFHGPAQLSSSGPSHRAVSSSSSVQRHMPGVQLSSGSHVCDKGKHKAPSQCISWSRPHGLEGCYFPAPIGQPRHVCFLFIHLIEQVLSRAGSCQTSPWSWWPQCGHKKNGSQTF